MNSDRIPSDLIQKYNVPGPRYTSYPTVPYWTKEQWSEQEWVAVIRKAEHHFQSEAISLYIHLPYCDSLCTFCGCHKHITTNHAVEEPYISAVLEEWRLLRKQFSKPFRIAEIHLGGGTPTFFSPQELKRLVLGLTTDALLTDHVEFGFEAHPLSTSDEHLQVLHDLGFNRVSFGIQDYDPVVQKAIHREQPFETVRKVHDKARETGFSSISHDLVFGLPKQKPESFAETVQKTISLRPDRISLYSYAHVPWIKGNGQRGFKDSDLPSPEIKRQLYEAAKQQFLEAGYQEIGMDHFALPNDELAIAAKNGNLHRNFMGYTTQQSPILIGLGMSAISDAWFGFAQNEKKITDYLSRVNSGKLPVTRGHKLNAEDLEIRQHILNLMCRFETTIKKRSYLSAETIAERLQPMIEDQLVEVHENTISLSPAGIPFVRNCCMAFDAHLNAVQPDKPTFSMTV